MSTTPNNPVQSCQPMTGCLSAEDREALDAVFIAHLRSQNATLTARVEELRDVLQRVNYTLVVHGHMDGGTGLHKLVEAVLRPKGAREYERALKPQDGGKCEHGIAKVNCGICVPSEVFSGESGS